MAMEQNKPFNPNEHLMQIKNGKGSNDYLPVQWRLVWFRSLCPDGTIETEMVHLDLDRETEEEGYAWNNETRRSEKVIKRAQGIAVFRATVKDGKGGMATGTKSEKAASFGDFLEKAETGAIGRALAALGYGSQFAGDEFDEQHRIVDAPVITGEPAPEHAPTLVEIFKIGVASGAWNTGTFYATASGILDGVSVSKNSILTHEQAKRLMEAAEAGAVEMSA